MSDKNSTRPKDTHGSWVVLWSGKDNEVPTMTSSNWAPGYTPAHCATQGEALAAAMAKVTRETAIVRQRWISLSMVLEQNRETYQNEVADGIAAQIADVPGVVNTKDKLKPGSAGESLGINREPDIVIIGGKNNDASDKPWHTFEARAERQRQIDKGYTIEHDDAHGLEHLVKIRDGYAMLRGAANETKANAVQIAIEEYLIRHPEIEEGYDDHQDH